MGHLLAANADVNAEDAQGTTPLFVACEQGSLANVTALLERGADTNATALDDGIEALARALECTARRLHVWNYAKVHAAGQHAASSSSAGRPGTDDTRIVPLQAVKFPTKTALLTALLAVRTVHWLRAAAKHAAVAAVTV